MVIDLNSSKSHSLRIVSDCLCYKIGPFLIRIVYKQGAVFSFVSIDDSDVQDYDDRKADLEEDRDADRETEGDSRSRKSWRSTHIKHRSELYRNNLRKGRYQRRKTYLLADVV